MTHKTLETSIQIYAPSDRVWNIFTKAELTRELGGEYVSDWFVGASIGWKNLDGKMTTNGTIVEIEPYKLLKYSVVSEKGTESSVIFYEFITVPFDESGGDLTLLKAREVFTKPQSEKAYIEAVKGWNIALERLKALAEKV